MKRVATLSWILFVLVFTTGCIRHTPESRLEKGYQAFNKKDYLSAYLEFDTFLQDYPENENAPLAARMRADCLRFRGDLESAAREYEAVVQNYPDNPEENAKATIGLTICRLKLGDATEAIEIVRPLFEKESSSEMAYERTTVKGYTAWILGDCYSRLNQPEMAVQYYTIFREESPFPFDKTVGGEQIAGTWIQAGSFQNAIQVYRDMLAATDVMPQRKPLIRFNLARTYAAAKNYDESLKVFDEIISATDLTPSDRRQLEISRTDILVDKGDLKSAIEVIKSIIESPTGMDEESVPHLYLTLAELYAKDKQIEEAAKTYQSLRNQSPNTIPALWGHVLEAMLYKETDAPRSEDIFNKAIVGLKHVMSATDTIQSLKIAVWAQLNLAYAYDLWGDRKMAMSVLEEGEKKYSADKIVYDDLALQQMYVDVVSRFQQLTKQAKEALASETPLSATATITLPEGGIADSSPSDPTAVGTLPAR